MAVDYTAVATTAATAVSAAGAVVLWSAQSARKPKPIPDEGKDEGKATRLAVTAPEIVGLILVGAVAALLVVRAITTYPGTLEEPSLLLMLGAVLLRGYRLARAGSPTIGRLAIALALVPGCGLLIGGLAIGAVTRSHDSEAAVYLMTGAPALVGALLWLRSRHRPSARRP